MATNYGYQLPTYKPVDEHDSYAGTLKVEVSVALDAQDEVPTTHHALARLLLSVQDSPLPAKGTSITNDRELPPADSSPERARDVALSINSVRSAHFTRRNDTITGVVYDGSTGIEFDVRLSGDVWYLNDDEGRVYEHTVLERAILRAIEANTNDERQSGGRTE
jgi:hypothetical protein